MTTSLIRRARLISGLILFFYVLTHFGNHAVGLISPEAADFVLTKYFFPFWVSWPATIALYGGFAVHYILALWALWQRRSLQMPFGEAAQLVLGFAIPFLLVDHVIGTRVADLTYGANVGYYVRLSALFFYESPGAGVKQLIAMLVVWVHACIGLRFAFRVKPWYEWAQPYLFAGALIVPLLALLGVVTVGRHVAMRAAADPAWFAGMIEEFHAGTPEVQAIVDRWILVARVFFGVTLLAVLLARLGRWWWQRRMGIIRIEYPDGRRVSITRGMSILEASRSAGIPHASVCGGRGRCSTCRVRVRGPASALPEPALDELKVLHRVGAPPGVRLACQLRPTGDIAATPLLPPFATAREGYRQPGYLQGSERDIAILFADLRAFTHFAETKLPYDVVFLLNRYFAETGRAIEAAGGRVDKFIGDGVMALFGLDSGVEKGCREALTAARMIGARLDELNRALAHDLDQPLRIGIGIHTGPAIVGEMGYGRATSLTAVGDAVNTASRCEAMTKEFDCELVVSEAVASRARVDLGGFPRHEVAIRGRREMLAVRTVPRVRDLVGLDASAAAPAPLQPAPA